MKIDHVKNIRGYRSKPSTMEIVDITKIKKKSSMLRGVNKKYSSK